MVRLYLFLSYRVPEVIRLRLKVPNVRFELLVVLCELCDLYAKLEDGQVRPDDGRLVVLAPMSAGIHVCRTIRKKLRLPLQVGRVKEGLVHRGQDVAQSAGRVLYRGAKGQASSLRMRGTGVRVKDDKHRVIGCARMRIHIRVGKLETSNDFRWTRDDHHGRFLGVFQVSKRQGVSSGQDMHVRHPTRGESESALAVGEHTR